MPLQAVASKAIFQSPLLAPMLMMRRLGLRILTTSRGASSGALRSPVGFKMNLVLNAKNRSARWGPTDVAPAPIALFIVSISFCAVRQVLAYRSEYLLDAMARLSNWGSLDFGVPFQNFTL